MKPLYLHFFILVLLTINLSSAVTIGDTDSGGVVVDIPEASINYSTITTNASNFWNTGDHGLLRNVIDILGSWITNDLNWINATYGNATYVPYSGAIADVDLGIYDLTAQDGNFTRDLEVWDDLEVYDNVYFYDALEVYGLTDFYDDIDFYDSVDFHSDAFFNTSILLQRTDDAILEIDTLSADGSSQLRLLADGTNDLYIYTYGSTAAGNLYGLPKAGSSYVDAQGERLVIGTFDTSPMYLATSQDPRFVLTEEGNLIPYDDEDYDIGNNTYRIKDIYVLGEEDNGLHFAEDDGTYGNLSMDDDFNLLWNGEIVGNTSWVDTEIIDNNNSVNNWITENNLSVTNAIADSIDTTWLANWTAYNESWSNTYNDTQNNSLSNYILYVNSTNFQTSAGEASWLANWTAYNTSWSFDYDWVSNWTAYNESWSDTYNDTQNQSINNYITENNESVNNNIDSSFITTYYNATQSSVLHGTIDGGFLNYTQHPDGHYDGTTFNFSEAAGGPGLDLRINFTNVSDLNSGVMRYKTSSLSGLYPIIQLWDYVDGVWHDFPSVGESLTFATITQPVFDADKHLSGGVVQMRIYKASNGNTNNHYYVDWVAVSEGIARPTGIETDPLSIHRDGNVSLTGNWNQSSFNLTNAYSWFLGKIPWTNVNGLNTTIDSLINISCLWTNESGTATYDGDVNASGVLYCNSTSKFCGIGTTSPTEKLHISAGQIRVDNNQGIGFRKADDSNYAALLYANPSNQLVVYANDVDFTGNTLYGNLKTLGFDKSDGTQQYWQIFADNAAGAYAGSEALGFYTLEGGLGSVLTLQPSGNVGINTTSPTHTLNVDGTSNITGNAYFEGDVNASGVLYCNSTSKMCGIGTASPGTTLSLPIENDATTPTISFGGTFGAGYTGFYSAGLTSIDFANAGVHTLELSTAKLREPRVGGSQWLFEAPSTINPIFSPGAGDPDTGLGAGGADQLDLITGGVNALHIDSSQNVGIGTTSPGFKLDIQGESATTFHNTYYAKVDTNPIQVNFKRSRGTLASKDNSHVNDDVVSIIGYKRSADSDVQVAKINIKGTGSAIDEGRITFDTRSTGVVVAERMRITEDGNVGINVTSPTHTLNVDGTSNITGNAYFEGDVNVTGDAIFGGNVGIGTTSPGYKLEVAGGSLGVATIIGTNNLKLQSSTGIDRLYLTGTGVGVGTTTINNMLTVNGNADFAGNVGINDTTPTEAKLVVQGETNGFSGYFSGNVSVGDIYYHSPFSEVTKEESLTNILKIKGENGIIDHSSVPDYAYVKTENPIYESVITQEERIEQVPIEENYTYSEEVCEYVETSKDKYSYVCHNEERQATRNKQDCHIEIKYDYEMATDTKEVCEEIQIDENTTETNCHEEIIELGYYNKIPYEEEVCVDMMINETYYEDVTTQNQIGIKEEEQVSVGFILSDVIKSIQKLFDWNTEQDQRIETLERELCSMGGIKFC